MQLQTAAATQLIIQGVPNRSTSAPNPGDQNVFWNGIVTCPPALSASAPCDTADNNCFVCPANGKGNLWACQSQGGAWNLTQFDCTPP